MADNPIYDENNVCLYDDLGNKIGVILDGSTYRLAVAANIEDDQKITINPSPGLPFTAFLENGGSSDMAVDGSSTPVEFSIEPPTDKVWYLHSLGIIIEDVGMNFAKYGGLSALTNGVDIKLKANNQSEITIGNIKRNGDYYNFVNELILESSTSDILVGKVLLPLNYGAVHVLRDSTSDYFKAVVNDNLTALDSHYIIARGYEVDA